MPTMPTMTTPPDTLTDLDDIAVLTADQGRWMGDPSTWAWDTHDETPGLLCGTCGHLTVDPDEPRDGDACRGWDEDERTGREYPCASADTARVIVRTDHGQPAWSMRRHEVVRPAHLA